MTKRILGLNLETWRELLIVAGLSLAVAFVGFFWDVSKNGRDLITYAQKALTQQAYVVTTVTASAVDSSGLAADGTYRIWATVQSSGDQAQTILRAVDGTGLGEFRFLGTAGGQPVGPGATEGQQTAPPPAPAKPNPAEPLSFFGKAADPASTLAILGLGTKTLGTDTYARFEIVPGQPVSDMITRGLKTYAKSFSKQTSRTLIYVNSRTKLPGYMVEVTPQGVTLTAWKYDLGNTVSEALNKFQGTEPSKRLALLGLTPTEAGLILSER